ncbi:hypothetical protein D3C85_1648430 [compost metagenome]
MLAVTHQVGLDVFVPDADLRGLVALAHHMEPPVAGAIAADVAHCGCPVVPPDQVGNPQVHGEQGGDDEQRALMHRVFRRHDFRRLDDVAPLQLGQ